MQNEAQKVVDIGGSRLCSGCKVEKNFCDFYFRNNKRNYAYQCKECENKRNNDRQKKLRLENPALIKARDMSYRKKYKTKSAVSLFKFPEDGRKNNRVKDTRVKTRQTSEDKKNYLLMKKYGITLEFVKEKFNSQMGLCANRACGKEIILTGGKDKRAHLDHCHSTGKIRGLLCIGCNMTLGHLENKNKVLGLTEYLNRYSD